MQRLDMLLQRLLARRDRGESGDGDVPDANELAVDRYTSAARFAAEQRFFARTPVPVALDVELEGPGACTTVDVAGVSVILVRGDDGAVRAFRNACRHRGTELVAAGAPCSKKAFVCPYHGWTYDRRGRRIHVPHEGSFGAKLDVAERDRLAPVHAESRHGLVWAALAPFDLDTHLAPIASDLSAIGLEHLALHRRKTREVAGNWKLVIDAFLDGYHIRHLHRDSIYRFFVDALFEAEEAGPHVRAVTARRTILRADATAGRDIRELATPSYVVFPSTVLVLHPDFTSVLTCTPRAADRTTFSHAMLVPKEDPREDHWQRSFALIDERVFGGEDLVAVEAIQRGLATGANASVLFGDFERASAWFHRTLDAAISG